MALFWDFVIRPANVFGSDCPLKCDAENIFTAIAPDRLLIILCLCGYDTHSICACCALPEETSDKYDGMCYTCRRVSCFSKVTNTLSEVLTSRRPKLTAEYSCMHQRLQARVLLCTVKRK